MTALNDSTSTGAIPLLPIFYKEPPYELSIGANENARPLLPLQPKSTSESRILVTKAYNDMLHRLLRIRMSGNKTGAVLIGQPGIGASP